MTRARRAAEQLASKPGSATMFSWLAKSASIRASVELAGVKGQ